MRRRDLILLLGGAAATWQFTPIAQAREPSRISILHSGYPNRTAIHLLYNALRALGYEHDRTATIDLYGGEGDSSRLATFASSPEVIFLPGVPSARRSYTPNSAYPAVRADRPTA